MSYAVAVDLLPDSISKLFLMFKNGKAKLEENYMLKADWDKFVTLIQAQKGAGMLEDPELNVWLSMQ
jgi:hypothetical protein